MVTVRPLLATDRAAWSALYAGYAAFYEVEQTEAMRALVRGWLQDPAHEVKGYLAVDAGEAYVEAGLEEVGAVGLAEVHFGVDGGFGGEGDLHFAGCNADCAFKARRPAGSKQLLGVRAGSGRAWRCEFNVQVAVGAAGYSLFASAGGVGFSGVQYFFDLFHVVLRFNCLFHNLIFFDFF